MKFLKRSSVAVGRRCMVSTGICALLILTVIAVDRHRPSPRRFALAAPLVAQLTVSLTGTPDPVAVNDTLTYVITVGNTGLDTALATVLTDRLPASAQFLSVPAAPGPCAQTGDEGTTGGTITCELGDLASGDTAAVTIQVAPTGAGSLTNAATAASSTADPDAPGVTATITTTVTPAGASTQPLSTLARPRIEPRFLEVMHESGQPAAVQATPCPVATSVCAFAAVIAQQIAAGDAAPLLAAAQPQAYICPGPVSPGAGGPYPLCDAADAGEQRAGYPLVHLQSEGDVLAPDDFRAALQRLLDSTQAQPYQLTTIGCPGIDADIVANCGTQLSLVFSDGIPHPLADQTAFWSVLAIHVQRAGDDQYAIVGAAAGPLIDTLPLPVELAGGTAPSGSPVLAANVPSTFFGWMPAAP
jgi:uncharacterized repeat protein (TIGR01451 family)